MGPLRTAYNILRSPISVAPKTKAFWAWVIAMLPAMSTQTPEHGVIYEPHPAFGVEPASTMVKSLITARHLGANRIVGKS